MLEKMLSQKAEAKERNARLAAYALKFNSMTGEQPKEVAGDTAESRENRE